MTVRDEPRRFGLTVAVLVLVVVAAGFAGFLTTLQAHPHGVASIAPTSRPQVMAAAFLPNPAATIQRPTAGGHILWFFYKGRWRAVPP